MEWKPLESFSVLLKGKYVRFKSAITEENLTSLINKKAPKKTRVAAGAIGLVYQVNGGTIFIGFSSNLRSPSPKGQVADPTRFAATIKLVIGDIDILEVES